MITVHHLCWAALCNRTRSRCTAAVAALFLVSLALPAAAQVTDPLPITFLSAGIHIIRAEVANTEINRRQGLMYRKALPDNEGMLFVFDEPEVQCFWMHNTLLPLSIAFMADDGTIINIEDMAPQTDDNHCAKQPVRYALEMAQGWFEQHGIQSGKRIDGLP
jgi:hypothetical protein